MSLLTIGMIITGIIGVGAHLNATDTNEKAGQIIKDAKDLYDDTQQSLKNAYYEMEQSLLNLGYKKSDVLEQSFKTFLDSYERIKDVVVVQTVGVEELSPFVIQPQEITDMVKMEETFFSSIGSGALGAAAGVALSLAATGGLSILTEGIMIAGDVLIYGAGLDAALGIIGTTFSISLSLTPLSVFIAPAILFSGVSADSKADINLEKAKVAYSEVKAESDKLKIKETIYKAVSERAVMLNELLVELDMYFSKCADLMQITTKRIFERIGDRPVTVEDITQDELNLIAVTRALAGAVKSVIDTPILTADGNVSEESLKTYNKTYPKLPSFKEASTLAKKEITLTKCPVCGGRVSPRAVECPHCNAVVNK